MGGLQNVTTLIPRKLAVPNSQNSLTRGSARCSWDLETSKLAVPLFSTQIRDSGYFLSPKNREFGGITVHLYKMNLPWFWVLRPWLRTVDEMSPLQPQQNQVFSLPSSLKAFVFDVLKKFVLFARAKTQPRPHPLRPPLVSDWGCSVDYEQLQPQ